MSGGWREAGDSLGCLDGEAGLVFRNRLDFRVEFCVVAGGGDEFLFSLDEDLLEVGVGRAHGYSGVDVRAGVQIADQAVGEDMGPGRFWGLVSRGGG